ncbi:MAG: phosphatase PAP2 family protein [Mediterranea sp.]|jgi:hypothetical protein|nr:phosphatase PAP2 family protein [Mediterranea sp.]
MKLELPSGREMLWMVAVIVFYFTMTQLFIGLRTEHFLLTGVFLILFLPTKATRKLGVALLPFALFGMSYDWMRVFPNYEMNAIDVQALYDAEKSLFGFVQQGITVTPCEYFATHHHTFADVLAGIFYLCWVPVPMAFGVWLYLTGKRQVFLRFSLAFLLVNLIGFAGYYIHPAAPPWYVMKYGLKPILGTPGNVAGLGRFDNWLGIPVFHSIYGRNSNVFAAVPSLHSAYMVVTLTYAVISKQNKGLLALFAVIMCGIWWTAVYTAHHYIIDVLLGILCALLGMFVFEKGVMRWKLFRRFFDGYYGYIKKST